MTMLDRVPTFLAPLALVVPLALGTLACDKQAEGTAQTKDQATTPAPIEGKPVEGGGKVASVPGGGETEPGYKLEIDTGEGKVGEEGKVTIKVVPAASWHVNLEYPTKLQVEAPSGVEVAKAEQGKGDAVALTEDNCEFAVTYTASEAGAKAFSGELRFAVCQEDACVPKSETLAFEVAVK